MGKTSSEVKRRYNEKHYTVIKVDLEKELVSEWEQKIKEEGITKAAFFRNAFN